jgi:hypothetical protein
MICGIAGAFIASADPRGFEGESVPYEYMTQPQWNGDRVNA